MKAKQGHIYQFGRYQVMAMDNSEVPVVHIVERDKPWPLRYFGRVDAKSLEPLPMVYFGGVVP